MDRRADDPRVTQLAADVAELKRHMAENTEITKQVKEILGSFKIVMACAKWITVVGAAITVLYHVVTGVAFIRK